MIEPLDADEWAAALTRVTLESARPVPPYRWPHEAPEVVCVQFLLDKPAEYL